MAIKVIAQRRVLKIGKNPGAKRFVMRPDLYIPTQQCLSPLCIFDFHY